MNEGYLLLEDSFKDYKLKVQIEDGETVWYSNGVAIMYGGINLISDFEDTNYMNFVIGLNYHIRFNRKLNKSDKTYLSKF